jgi:hypothetical protein
MNYNINDFFQKHHIFLLLKLGEGYKGFLTAKQANELITFNLPCYLLDITSHHYYPAALTSLICRCPRFSYYAGIAKIVYLWRNRYNT